MKKALYTLMISFLLSGLSAQGLRYLEEVFPSVKVTKGIEYARNATILYAGVTGEAMPESLLLDIYEPMGDPLPVRPLIIYFHSGNFLPYPQNQSIVGTRADSSSVQICTKLARMGFLVASADYRLGWSPLDPDEEKRRSGIINAAYRGVQDANTCIRFFKKNCIEFGADTCRITLFGDDTGGYIAVHAASLDSAGELLEDPQLYEHPDIEHPKPMIVDSVNGDVEGKLYGINIPPILGLPIGDTLCYSNYPEYSSRFQVAVNIAGGLVDTNWIDPGQPPIISIQTPFDNTTPYLYGTVYVGGVYPVIKVFGAQGISIALDNRGINQDVFSFPGVKDPFQLEVSHIAQERSMGLNGLFPIIGETPEDIIPWVYWDPELNPNYPPGLMSKEKAITYIDSIIAFVAPRLYNVLKLNEPSCLKVSTDRLLSDPIDISLSPNPSSDEIEICTPADKIMREVKLLNATGSLVAQQKGIDNNVYRLNVSKMVPGMYIVQIRFDKGITARQIIVQ